MKKIIICPFYFEKTLLSSFRKSQPFFDVKFIDKESVFKCYFGEFKKDAVIYLIKKYKISYTMAKTYLGYLAYLNENKIDDEKSKYLYEIKMDLINHGYYKKDCYFLNLIKGQEVSIIGYSDKDIILNKILDNLGCTYHYENNLKKNDDSTFFEYSNHEEEVHSLMIKICDLLAKGIDINNIFVYGANKDYQQMIERYAKLYNIPFNGFEGYKLAKLTFGKLFFNQYFESHDFNETLLKLDEKYSADENYLSFKQSLLDKYDEELDFAQQYDIFKNAINDSVKPVIYDNAVTILKDLTYLENKYVFVIGFAQGNFPLVKSDNQFLPDDIKSKHYILTTKQENIINKQELLSFLRSNNHFEFSYASKVFGNVNYVSFLAQDLNLKKVKGQLSSHDYCDKAAQIELLKLKDLSYKYKENKPELASYGAVVDFKYRDFDNQFKWFKALDENMTLWYSYTSFSAYIDCPFAYYLKYVLKIDDFETNFGAKLGTAFHGVLEDGLKHLNEDFETLYSKHFDIDDFDAKEKLFCTNLKDDVEVAFNTVRDQLKRIRNPQVELEKEIIIDLTNKAKLKGKIDKMIIADNKFLAIIDYKTGTKQSFSPNKLPLGKSMQLPTYALLLSQAENYKHLTLGGLYINYIVPTGKKEKPVENGAPTYLRLEGKSLTSMEYLTAMEPGYPDKDVRYINITPKANVNEYPSRGTFKPEDKDYYIQTCRDIYLQCDANIRQNHFKIAPSVNGSDSACTFCPFKDICFVKMNQYRIEKLPEKEEKADD